MKFLMHLLVLTGMIPSVARSQAMESMGAASLGIAHSSVTLADGASIFNNPAALGFLENTQINVGYINRFEVEGLSTQYASYSKAFSNAGIAVGVSQYGDSHFRHTMLSPGVANKWGIASLGISISIHQVSIEGFGSRVFPTLNFSGLAELSPRLYVGGFIRNITQSRISKTNDLYYPTSLATGISYRAESGLNLHVQVEKDLIEKAVARFGLEYHTGAITLRTGINTMPLWYSFGLGLSKKRFGFDYGIQFHPSLQRSHALSLGYRFIK